MKRDLKRRLKRIEKAINIEENAKTNEYLEILRKNSLEALRDAMRKQGIEPLEIPPHIRNAAAPGAMNLKALQYIIKHDQENR